jgi:diguanylate cyclase (GGDEF)-like protein/putative nucleotidyltransferase with HDIG domain
MNRAVRVALCLGTAWLAAYEAHALGLGWIPVGDVETLHLVVLVIGAAACLARAGARREERLAWALIGAGMLAWTAGEVYYTNVLWNDPAPPVPSPADAGYLLLPLLVFAGLLQLLRERVRGLAGMLWLDGLTAALAVGSLSAAVVVQVVLATVGGDVLSVATNLAYPVTDMVLLGVIAGGLAATGWRVDRTFALLAAGVVAFWIADSVYLVQTARGAVESESPFDAGWWGAAVLFGAAAWAPAGRQLAVRAGRGLRVVVMPSVFAILSLGVLVTASVVRLNPGAVGLAAAAMVAVIARLLLTFRENVGMLDASRHEAHTDPLTGLGNRRRLTADLERALGEGGTLVLALFDLDGFKHYNDTFGHPAGDVLLARLGANLNAFLDGRGHAFRMGGDEFCVVVRASDAEHEKVVRACSLVLQERGDGFEIGASHGAVVLPEEADDVHEALRLADQRMYALKHRTRTSAGRQSRDVLVRALVERDPGLAAHAKGVAALAERLARALGLEADEVEHVRQAAELHDVGKVAIPDGILDKPGPLDESEWAFVRRHTLIGERIVRAAPALTRAAAIVRASHERWDGSGYPDGLAGEQIPLGSRIVAVCDAYDAMTSRRAYAPALAPAAALGELRAGAATQFDPAVVESLAAVLAEPGHLVQAA